MPLRTMPVNIRVIRIRVPVCIRTSTRIPSAMENQPGDAIPADFSKIDSDMPIIDTAAMDAQATPTRTSTSSAKIMKARNPCKMSP